MTALAEASDAPDGRHGWIWGCTTAALGSLGFPGSTMIAAAVAGLLVLVPPREDRRGVLLGGLLGGFVMGVIVPWLSGYTLQLVGQDATGDAAILAVLVVGALSGLASGLSGRVVTLPGFRTFRLMFLELCVLTGMIGGFLSLPKLHFLGAADAGGRITFAAALLLLFIMLPASLGHLLGRQLRHLVLKRPA